MVAVTLWYGAGMSTRHRPQVHFIDGNLQCCDEIMWPITMPFIRCHRHMLQHDNAWPHVARISTQFLEAGNIPVLARPIYSPIAAPIEHVWDADMFQFTQRVKRSGHTHSTGRNQTTNQLYVKCVIHDEGNGVYTKYWLVFQYLINAPMSTSICTFLSGPRRTCTTIMLFNQHHDMPRLSGGSSAH